MSEGENVEHIKKLLYTIRWSANKIRESKGKDYLNLTEDIVEISTEILDTITGAITPHTDSLTPIEGFEYSEEDKELIDRGPKEVNINKKVAIVIGHNKNTGARAHDGSDEWTTRSLVAQSLQDFLRTYGVESKIFIRNGAVSYGAAMREHGRNIDAYGADLAIELHFNASSNPEATGTEFIVCSKSTAKVAKNIAYIWGKFYPDLPLRHDEGVLIRTSGLGVGFCRAPKAPAIIYEPCFASNASDWALIKGQHKREAQVLGLGIVEALLNL